MVGRVSELATSTRRQGPRADQDHESPHGARRDVVSRVVCRTIERGSSPLCTVIEVRRGLASACKPPW